MGKDGYQIVKGDIEVLNHFYDSQKTSTPMTLKESFKKYGDHKCGINQEEDMDFAYRAVKELNDRLVQINKEYYN